MATIKKKFVILGDGLCGKTCLLIVFTKDQFPESCLQPPSLETYVTVIEVDGKQVRYSGKKFCYTVLTDINNNDAHYKHVSKKNYKASIKFQTSNI